ncbi:MAG TPA: cupin domain-containing protein [Gaiellaceae bacterium]|nr:cupin domain-containing protein [Gaiellaceae bacterium]
MEYCLARTDLEPAQAAGDAVSVLALFDDARGCEKFAQRVLTFPAGVEIARIDEEHDEVLYVLRGAGRAVAGDSRAELAPDVSIYAGRGTAWAIEASEELELVSVLVRDPEPVDAGSFGTVDIQAETRGTATASRQFTLGAWAGTGCLSVTQFVGFVPPGRAPDHYHRYDEVIYILEGTGILHIDGEQAPVGPGSCIHLPRMLVHSLENSGDTELRLLGVFRPSGSPAEAYYPDGTRAVYEEES